MIIIEKEKYNTVDKVLIECDFKISPKCKGKFFKLYKNILKTRLNNNGKDRCCYCFNSITKTGENNFNFKYQKNENFFENIDCELKAYLLGFIAGDGCIKKDGLNLENHVSDIEVLKLFKDNISPNSPFHKHHDPVRGVNTICLKIHSVKIVKDLLKHLKLKTYGKKSDKIQLPDLPDDLMWCFIRGLFDSDGSVPSPLFSKRTAPISSISSTSLKMREDIINLCNKLSIKFYHDNNAQVIFTGKNALLFLDKIYNNSTYYLSRKYNNWIIWKTWIPYKGTSVKSRKLREHYPPISEAHKERIRESNRTRKRTKKVENV